MVKHIFNKLLGVCLCHLLLLPAGCCMPLATRRIYTRNFNCNCNSSTCHLPPFSHSGKQSFHLANGKENICQPTASTTATNMKFMARRCKDELHAPSSRPAANSSFASFHIDITCTFQMYNCNLLSIYDVPSGRCNRA